MPRKSKALTDIEAKIASLKNDPVFLKETVRIQRGEIKVMAKHHKLARDLILELYLDAIKGNEASVKMSDPVRCRVAKVLKSIDPDCYLFREIK